MRHFQAGEIIAGKFRLQHPLARGGMGSVWTAWNEQLEVPVAVKFMSAEALGSAELIARFEREAKAAAQMRSPQVVQIYEHGVFNGVPFMVMELLEGEDLGKRIRLRGRLPLPEIARICTEVCKALRRAHELGIVHRDLKPANVFLARSGDDEVVKVLDFGIAKVLDSAAEATKTGALIGTPNYMSPEQARRSNRKVDHRSDLWSLGVIAFRALTGKLPFAGDDPINVLVQICTSTAPAPSSFAPDVGPAADRFFARALASDPDHRFQNARDFAEALNALAAGPTPYRSLGSSWGGEIPPPHSSSPGPARAASQPAYALPAVSARAARAPAAGPVAAQRSAHSPHPPPADPFDGATTVPIQQSSAGQAMLAAASSPPAPVPSRPQAAAMSRMPSSPRGFQPPRAAAPSTGSPPVHGAPANQHARTAPLAIHAAPPQPLSSSSSSWQADAGAAGKPFLRTLPLGTPAAANLPRPPLASTPESQASAAQGPPRPPLASIPESQAAAPSQAAVPSLFPAAATTSAGESAGTITSATGELPARQPRRKTSFVVWGALAAGVIVILVVGSVVVTSPSATPAPDPTIPLPPGIAPTLRADAPEPHPTPTVTPQSTEAVPPGDIAASPSSSAAAEPSASGQPAAAEPSASGQPAALPTASASQPAASPGIPPKPSSKPGKNSVIFGERVF